MGGVFAFIVSWVNTILFNLTMQGFPFENFGGGGQDSPHLGKSVGGGKYMPIFGGGETQFYQFNG